MNNLSPVAFITPVVALLLSVFFFWVIWKKTALKQAFARLSFMLVIISFILNFAWEMLQMPLFEGMQLSVKSVFFCALASIADVLMVLLLYYVFTIVYRNILWIKIKVWIRVAVLILIGATGAITIEKLHVTAGNWSYSKYMPVIPVVNVGLSPVLQFMILPAISYSLSFYFFKRKYNQKINFLNNLKI